MIAFLKKFYIGLRYKIKRRFRKKKVRRRLKVLPRFRVPFIKRKQRKLRKDLLKIYKKSNKFKKKIFKEFCFF